MNDIQILTKVGLSEKQAIVYTTLLGLGEASMSAISRFAKLKRPTVYLLIAELELLGLVSEIQKGKKKKYSAVHPKRIAELLEFRKNQFQEILPELVALQNTAEKPKVRMLEGLAGMHTAYEEAWASLNNKEEGLLIGNTGLLQEKFPEIHGLYNKTLAKLNHPKIREIIHGGESSKKWIRDMQKYKLSKNHSMRYASEAVANEKAV